MAKALTCAVIDNYRKCDAPTLTECGWHPKPEFGKPMVHPCERPVCKEHGPRCAGEYCVSDKDKTATPKPKPPRPAPKTARLARELRGKDDGMGLAARNRKLWLDRARAAARLIGADGRGVTANDVQDYMEANYSDYRVAMLGNAAGSIFKTSEWIFTGDRINSTRPGSHAREVKVWKLMMG